jgi:hypothetical protein
MEIAMTYSRHYFAALVVAAIGFTSNPEVVAKEHASRGGGVPGFYIQIDMCHACAYPDWQKEAASALGRYGVQAFASDDIQTHATNNPFYDLKVLPLRTISDEGWPVPIYAGPFTTDRAARQLMSRLPKILENEIAKSKEGSGRQQYVQPVLENCAGNHCDLEGYFLHLIRLRP